MQLPNHLITSNTQQPTNNPQPPLPQQSNQNVAENINQQQHEQIPLNQQQLLMNNAIMNNNNNTNNLQLNNMSYMNTSNNNNNMLNNVSSPSPFNGSGLIQPQQQLNFGSFNMMQQPQQQQNMMANNMLDVPTLLNMLQQQQQLIMMMGGANMSNINLQTSSSTMSHHPFDASSSMNQLNRNMTPILTPNNNGSLLDINASFTTDTCSNNSGGVISNNNSGNSSNGNNSDFIIPMSPRSNNSANTLNNVNLANCGIVCVLFHPNGQYLNVLHDMKVLVPELVGSIIQEDKIKCKLTENKKKRYFFLNISKPGVVEKIAKTCKSILIENEPILIDLKRKSKKVESTPQVSSSPNPQVQPKLITIPVNLSPIQLQTLQKFFLNDLNIEMNKLCGKNSFFIQKDSILFVVESVQPQVSDLTQYLKNQVFNILQRARFVEFFGDSSNVKRRNVSTKLTGCEFHVVESKKGDNMGSWFLSSLNDLIYHPTVNDLFITKFIVPIEKFELLKKKMHEMNIYFKDSQQNDIIILECIFKKENEYNMVKKYLKKDKNEKKLVVDKTAFRFIQKYSSYLVKDGIKSLKDPKDPNIVILTGVGSRKSRSIQFELKKIKSVKLELHLIHSSLKGDFTKEADQYFEQLTEIQTVWAIVTPEKSKNIIIFFAIVENQEIESKIKNELTELLKGSSEVVQAKQANDILLRKLSGKLEKFKKDITCINIDYEPNKKTFYIKGLREEDVKEVKSRIESELEESKEKRIKLTFNNIIEKNLAMPLLKSTQQKGIAIIEQGTSITVVGSSQEIDQFIHNSYQRVMSEVRKKVLVDFITMQHDEFKFFSEKNIETKGKIVLEKKLDSGIKQVHKFGKCFIYIAQGDMFDTKWKAQVLVNSANNQLQHGGGIASTCAKLCGEDFNRECKEIVKNKTLKVSDVVPTTSGNLHHLSKVYNAIPPQYSSYSMVANNPSHQLLAQTVINILNQAENDGYSSIIIPALSSGIFGFPLNEATGIIVKTIHEQSSQLSSLREIILIGDVSNVTESFTKSINLLESKLIYSSHEQKDFSIVELEQDEYVGCFKYFDDIKKMYLPFTVNDNRKLCEQYEKDPKSTFILSAEQGKKYKINFEKMEQVEARTMFKRNIIYVPSLDSEYLSSIWFWLGDDNKVWHPYRENQMKEIERKFVEGKEECEVFMTNEKYTSEDIKYFVKFDYSTQTHEQINSKTKFSRKVRRAPVIKIVKCNEDMVDLNKNSILYVYAEDETHYTFVRGSMHMKIPISSTTPYEIVKKTNLSKKVELTDSFSFRVYGEKDEIKNFKLSFQMQVKDNYIRDTLSKSCNQYVIDHIISEHASMKAKIEKGLLKLDTSSTPYTITGFKYTVDKFKEYTLFTIADRPELLSKFSYPRDWLPQTSNVSLVELSQSSSDWKTISERIKQTIPNAVVQKIEKVQNQLIYQSYKTEQDRINKIKIDLNGKYTTDPLLLFHGTRTTDPSIIYDGHEGFDMRFSNTGMWGVGCYFAVNASYSHGYAYPIPNSNSRKFFLAEVLTGDFIDFNTKSDNTLRVPPNKPNTNNIRYDSVKGHTGGSDVYIVYKNSQAYPKFLITYTTL